METEDKKKLRTMNTTLRGEKIMLENQLQGLRKKNNEIEELYGIVEAENKKIKL